MPVQPDDLTARARIREAALDLFARDGYSGASVRSVAARAKVSPSLVVHHFKTKSALRDAVDDAVLATLDAALRTIDTTGRPVDVVTRISEALGSAIADDHSVRTYLGRVLADGTAGSRRFVEALGGLIGNGLRELQTRGVVRRDVDLVWSSYAVVFVVLGPVLLHSQLGDILGVDPFEPSVVRARVAANTNLFHAGLFV